MLAVAYHIRQRHAQKGIDTEVLVEHIGRKRTAKAEARQSLVKRHLTPKGCKLLWREVGLRHERECLDGLLCLGTIVHLGKHLWKGTAHLVGIAIHILYESLADALKTISVHRKVHLGCVQLNGSVAGLARAGAFPLYGTMLCHSVVVNAHARIQSTSLILINDEVGCLLDIGIRVLSLLADRTETRGLTLDALLVGRLHEKVQVDVSEAIYDRMKEHDRSRCLKRIADDLPNVFDIAGVLRLLHPHLTAYL